MLTAHFNRSRDLAKGDAREVGLWTTAITQVPEEEALLLIVASHLDEGAHNRLRHLLASSAFDWQRFWVLAGEQQVQPLVAHMMIHAPWASVVPSTASGVARMIGLRATMRNMAIDAELRRISDLLGELSIPVAPLKGTCLARQLFGSVAARQCGDIDILVPERHWEIAYAALGNDGYHPEFSPTRPRVAKHAFHGVPLRRTTCALEFSIELHWMLNDPRFVSIDYGNLWARIMDGRNDDSSMHALPPEENLAYLALHLAKHNSGRLRLLVDIDRLVKLYRDTLDWEYVGRLTHQWHTAEMLSFSLRMSSLLLGTDIPNGVGHALRPRRMKRAIVSRLIPPVDILRPDDDHNEQFVRYKAAYCTMLNPPGRMIRSYWYYIIGPSLGQRFRTLAGGDGV